jgi:hypothetical protein
LKVFEIDERRRLVAVNGKSRGDGWGFESPKGFGGIEITDLYRKRLPNEGKFPESL